MDKIQNVNTYYASYNLCFICLKNNIPFTHCSGNFKFENNTLISYGEVIGIPQIDGTYQIIGEPFSPVQGKHYAVIRRYNDYVKGKVERENLSNCEG
ncbi:MAG TPA: hypothetical protein PLE74_01135 [Candidatus Cloacimonadota bacterium]|nr:hypothetical protein [Candidatus Cloacimonadota bacterium]